MGLFFLRGEDKRFLVIELSFTQFNLYCNRFHSINTIQKLFSNSSVSTILVSEKDRSEKEK